MSTFSRTEKTRIRRVPKRAIHDRDAVYAMIDEAMVAHVGFVVDGQRYVIPVTIVRLGDYLYLHGSRNSRMIRVLESGAPACITVTHLDGLVVARSGFHSSMNYRSVIVFGTAEKVTGSEKADALDRFTERLIPGRGADLRPHRPQELRATTVLRVALEEISAKARTGPPIDDEDDYALPVWAGVIPLRLTAGSPEPDPKLRSSIPVPPYLSNYRR